MFSLDDYAYDLPESRIAQRPQKERDRSKLLVLDRKDGSLSHRVFYEICELLSDSDVMVVNNTEVIPGRLVGKKGTGGRTELLILDYASGGKTDNTGGTFECDCLIKASKRPKPGTTVTFEQGLTAEVIDSEAGIHRVRFSFEGDFETLLYRIGRVPLPPYISRGEDGETCDDDKTYQTVYASAKGAIAAPTAGFHFTPDLLEKIRARGVRILTITLHVGYGTFLPVRVTDIREHRMHAERFSIPRETADAVNRAKAEGGRIIAVGTTCVRTLEYAADPGGKVGAGTGDCDLFIYPGFEFKVVDAMITNFHLPRSTLLMLVSAFAGRKNVLKAYQEAIESGYRFYSYGDAMFIH